MQVLIFALLTVVVSAHNYGYEKYYSSHPSYGYGSSLYGSSYGSGYGSGYGSSYGSSYGSGIGYGQGGSGQSYYSSGNIGGYNPSVYETSSHSYTYPYGTATDYKRRSYEYSTSGGPARIVYTQDFSGVPVDSVYQQETPVISTFNERKQPLVPQQVFSLSGNAGHLQGTGGHGVTDTAGVSGIQIVRETAGIGEQHIRSILTDSNEHKLTAGGVSTLPKVSTSSYRKPGTVHSSHSQGLGVTGGQTHVSHSQDYSKVAGQTGVSSRKPVTHVWNKYSVPRAGAFVPKISSGFLGSSGYRSKNEGYRTGHIPGQGHISFTQDFSKVRGPTQTFVSKPEIPRFDKISVPVTGSGVARHSPGYTHRISSTPKASGQRSSSVGGSRIFFALGDTVLQSQGPKPAGPTVSRPTISRGTGSTYKAGTRRVSSSGQSGETVFGQGVSGHALRPAGKPLVSTFGTAPINLGPRKPSSRYSEVRKTLPKNEAHSFSTSSGPSRISFTKDFSKVSGGHAAAIKPEIANFDQFSVSKTPSTTHQGFKPVQITAVARKPVQRPVSEKVVYKTQKQHVSQQPTFSAVHGQSYGQLHSSLVGGQAGGDGTIFLDSPNSGFDGYSTDYKHNTGITGDRQSSFVIVPGTTAAHDKSSVLEHSSVAIQPIAGGVHHTSTGHGVLGDSISYESHSKDKSTVFVAIPAEDSKIAPTGSFVEEKESFHHLSPEVPSVSSLDSHVPQLPVT